MSLLSVFGDERKFVTLPLYLRVAAGSVVEGFEGAGWDSATYPAGGSFADNVAQFGEGAHSRKLTTGTTAATAYRTYRSANGYYTLSLAASDQIEIWLYLHDTFLGNYGATAMRLGASSAFTKYWSVDITGKFQLYQGQVAHVVLPHSAFTAVGGMTWADTVTDISFTLTTGASASAVNTSWDNIITGIQARPAILMQFDDGYDSTYGSVYPIMKAHGCRANVCVASGVIGTGGRYTTWAHLQELYAANWAICNHGNAMVDPTGENVATQQARYQACADALTTNGMPKNKFTMLDYMNAGYDAATWTAMDNLGIVIGRRSGGSSSWIQTLPYHDYKQTFSLTISDATSWATVQGWIDLAIADKTILMVHFHDIDNTGDWTGSQIQTLVNYLVFNRNNISVITWDDYRNLMSGPVTVPVLY